MTWAPGAGRTGEISSPSRVIGAGRVVVDATIIAAPSSTKNVQDPGPGDTQKKGNRWYWDEGHRCRRGDRVRALGDRDSSDVQRPGPGQPTWSDPMTVVYADAGCQGVEKRGGRRRDRSASRVRIAARKGAFAGHAQDRVAPGRYARQVEHPFLTVKRDFGFTKTRYRGLAKNLNHLNMLFLGER